MNGHINETAPPLVPIGEVKLVQVEIVVWFVRTCEVSILFVLLFAWLNFLFWSHDFFKIQKDKIWEHTSSLESNRRIKIFVFLTTFSFAKVIVLFLAIITFCLFLILRYYTYMYVPAMGDSQIHFANLRIVNLKEKFFVTTQI